VRITLVSLTGDAVTSRKESERAVEYFDSGFNCAESVLLAVAEAMQLDGCSPQKFATAFGAGIARHGGICGCLAGAAVAVGLAVGRVSSDDQDSKELVYAIVNAIFESFAARLHTVECRELTGIDFSDREHLRDALSRVHSQICCPLVSFTSELTVSQLEAIKNQERPRGRNG
jgi:C_GCAxxG_C_C family probable redox protein